MYIILCSKDLKTINNSRDDRGVECILIENTRRIINKMDGQVDA